MHAYTFQTVVNGETVRIPSNCGFDGKKLIITIVELPIESIIANKKWSQLGTINLKDS